MPVSQNGYDPETSEQKIARYKSYFDESYNLSVDITTEGKETTALANIFLDASFLTEDSFDQAILNQAVGSAFGIQLDNLAFWTGNTRNQASASTVLLTFAGIANGLIPAGFACSSSAYSLVFRTLSDLRLDGTGSGSVIAQCTSQGSDTNIPENSITTIVNPTSIVFSVNNLSASFGGLDLETDIVFTNRLINQDSNNIGTAQNIIRQLRALVDVTFVDVQYVTPALPSLDQFINFLIQGGDDQSIAQVFYDYGAVPFPTIGSVEVDFVNDFGRTVTYFFDRPTPILIDVQINIQNTEAFSEGFLESLPVQLQTYLENIRIDGTEIGNGLKTGINLSGSELVASIMTSFINIFREDFNKLILMQILVKLDTSATYSNNLQFSFDQFPSLKNVFITTSV